MSLIIATLLAVIAFLLWRVLVCLKQLVWKTEDLVQASEGTTEEIKSLRLKSRARIATASARTGALTEDQELRRVGRATAARRVVVGGDGDSQLNQDLVRQSVRGHDKEEATDE